MTLLLHQFDLTPTSESDTQILAASGSLPQRLTPSPERNSFVDALDSLGAAMHYRFNELTSPITDRVNTGFEENIGSVTFGAATLVESPKNSSIIFNTSTANDLVISNNGLYNFDYNQKWSIDMWCEPQNGTGDRWMLTKFDGTNGWIVHGPMGAGTDFGVEFRDGTNILKIRASVGTNVYGTAGANINHFTVVVDGDAGTLDSSKVRLYFNGVLQTNIVDTAGPVSSFASSADIESGNMPSTGATNSERTAVLWDELCIANQAWDDADVLLVHEAGLEIQDLPEAVWQYTAAEAVTIEGINIPGALGNENIPECFPDIKTQCFYSVNEGSETEFFESINNMSLALGVSSTLEVIVRFPPRGQHLTDVIAWVGDAEGQGPVLLYDDGELDEEPTAPPTTGDPPSGASGRLVSIDPGS